MVPQNAIAQLCAKLFDRIQDSQKEHQIAALACAFALITETCDIHAGDALAVASNVMKDDATSTRRNVTFDGLAYHLATDILAQEPA